MSDAGSGATTAFRSSARPSEKAANLAKRTVASDFQPCPSCGHALHRVDGESTPGITVFSCPVESLRYLRRPGAGLQPYTRGPFVAPLYSVIFSSDPVSEAEDLAQRLLNEEPADDILFMILACEAELESPSCRLQTLYDYANDLSEHQLRDFLRQYSRRLRELRVSANP